ncbi:MAG: hypothetical protein RMJ07_04580 [Nitrososphaerota archaeon]|nr:hypothetical protein [Candidatus Bathyarchaeota archaeon]MDW8048940.1 hypothetical protein [Nitrososphaerota archaeon]
MGGPMRRRGQSQIVESLLMLVITFTACAIAYAAASTAISFQRQGTLIQMRERLVIEDVWFTGSNTLRIYVRNIGSVDINIVSVSVGGTVASSMSPSKLKLPPNQGGWLNCSFSQAWSAGVPQRIIIVSERGSRFVTEATP